VSKYPYENCTSYRILENFKFELFLFIIICLSAYYLKTYNIKREKHRLRVFENKVLTRYLEIGGGGGEGVEWLELAQLQLRQFVLSTFISFSKSAI
jgi:hypothetical protein